MKSTDLDREAMQATARRVLATLAAWTNLVFDGSAGRRLSELDLPPDGVFGPNLPTYDLPHSAGVMIEESVALTNLTLASQFTSTGVWDGTLEEMAGVITALEPFRMLIELDALSGPYSDALVNEDDRAHVLAVLNRLIARRNLARGLPLTLSQLANLAGLSEKTIRMAAISRNRSPDLQTYKEKSSTLVRAAEVERWLSLREDYRPTRIKGELNTANILPRTNHQIATAFSTLRERVRLSTEDLAERMNWGPHEKKTYEVVEEGWFAPHEIDAHIFDVRTVAQLAQVFKVEQPEKFIRSVAQFFLDYQLNNVTTTMRKDYV